MRLIKDLAASSLAGDLSLLACGVAIFAMILVAIGGMEVPQ